MSIPLVILHYSFARCITGGVPAVAPQVKDSVLSFPWLSSLLRQGFKPWPGNFPMPLSKPPKKKKKRKHHWGKVSKEFMGSL